MASIKIIGASKTYADGGRGHQALRNVSMEIEDGSFVALLGRSGSGKTTLLRTIAGLERLDEGCIEIDGVVVSGPGIHVPPEQRKVAVVFQNHALWPQMTVLENVMFPLLMKEKRSAETTARAQDALKAVELAELADRYPDQLSGGQKQRVALARALVGSPQAILFDEPLASLDVELRRDMQRHIARARTGRTAIVYVTHNQEEALALADKVAVLEGGRIQQLASPLVISQEPATRMIASFVGGRNILKARVVADHGDGTMRLALGDYEFCARYRQAPAQSTVWVTVQPAAFEAGSEGIELQADYVFFQGDSYLVEGTCLHDKDAFLTVRVPLSETPSASSVLRVAIRDAWVLSEAVE